MNISRILGERLIALFLLAVLLLNPPLILIFDRPSTVAGFPILYIYLFVAWAILIALLAIVAEGTGDSDDSEASQSTEKVNRDNSEKIY